MSRVVRGLHLALAAGLLFGLLGCTGSGDAASGGSTHAASPRGETPGIDGMPADDGVVSPGELPTYEIGQPDERIADSLPAFFNQVLDVWDLPPDDRKIVEQATATGRIEEAAYEAAHEQYAQCMVERGFEPQFRKTQVGVYRELGYASEINQDSHSSARIDCLQGNALIIPLYETQQNNPDLLVDTRPIGFECLKEHGYVHENYTILNFEESLVTSAFPFSQSADEPNDCLYLAGYSYIN